MFALRAERPEDGPAIESLLDQAFGANRTDRISYRYRSGIAPVPGLSQVACSRRGFVIGTIRYWPVAVGPRSRTALLLGPLAVTGACQGRGVGAALMRATLAHAKAGGHERVLLAGDLAYYNQFGFAPADAWSIVMPDEDPRRLLALALVDGALNGCAGDVRRWRSLRGGAALRPAAERRGLAASHLLALARAGAAGLGAIRHDRVGDPLAVRGAHRANLGADAADVAVDVRAAGHQGRREMADVAAIPQQPDMVARRVLAAARQTMDGGLPAASAAELGGRDAVAHVHIDGPDQISVVST
jgi:predicted N-acetyltransferase YhbS